MDGKGVGPRQEDPKRNMVEHSYLRRVWRIRYSPCQEVNSFKKSPPHLEAIPATCWLIQKEGCSSHYVTWRNQARYFGCSCCTNAIITEPMVLLFSFLSVKADAPVQNRSDTHPSLSQGETASWQSPLKLIMLMPCVLGRQLLTPPHPLRRRAPSLFNQVYCLCLKTLTLTSHFELFFF